MVRGNANLHALGYTDYTIATAVASLIATLQKKFGLVHKLELPNLKSRGRDRYAYKRGDLKKSLEKFKDSTKFHRNRGRIIIVDSLLSTFNFIDQNIPLAGSK
jgi:hypothetical protein